jgi:hypothetical protein
MAYTRTKNGHHDHPAKWLLPMVVTVAIWAVSSTVSGAWWAAGQNSAMASTQDTLKTLQSDVRMLQSKNDRLAVVETKLEAVVKSLERLEASLNRPGGRPRS